MTEALETEVRRMEQARSAATLLGTTDRLEPMLADELVFAHSSGGVDTKSTLLAKLASGAFAYSAYQLDLDRVVATETVAIATGRLRAALDVHGEEVRIDSVVTDVWVQRSGGPQLLAVSSRDRSSGETAPAGAVRSAARR